MSDAEFHAETAEGKARCDAKSSYLTLLIKNVTCVHCRALVVKAATSVTPHPENYRAQDDS